MEGLLEPRCGLIFSVFTANLAPMLKHTWTYRGRAHPQDLDRQQPLVDKESVPEFHSALLMTVTPTDLMD